MKYLHYVANDTKTFETNYSASKNPKISMECLAKIRRANYSIIDRETNQIICLIENGIPV